MAYRLKRGRPLEAEMRRLLDRQLQLAISSLRQAGTPDADREIHDARRHVKKARAVLRLFEPVLGRNGGVANKRLRTVGRMLAPIADGEAIVKEIGRLGRRYPRAVAPRTRAAVRLALVHREARIDEQAKRERVIQTARALLRAERRRLPAWGGGGDRFRVLVPGLRRVYRSARARYRSAAASFTGDNCHSWRRRVKDHWYHLRLLERRCGSRLAPDRHRVEMLDGWLGEYQNCAVLADVLSTNDMIVENGRARYLALVRRHQRALGRDARRLGAGIYRETPRQFVSRLHEMWRVARRRPSLPRRRAA